MIVMASASPAYARQPRIIARHIAGETLLVPTRPGAADFQRIFLLNQVGAFVWQKLAEPRRRDELVALVAEEFATGPEHDVGADVDRFLAELRQRDLLQDLGDDA